MASAVMDTMSIDLQNGHVIFRATGSKIKFPGFMKVYVEGTDDRWKKKKICFRKLTEGDTCFSKDMDPKQHFTQPPPRYTEARLVKTLEELGIGRPSTYAPTLDTIQKRGYVTLDNKRFIPTELGEIVLELIREFFPEIIDTEFTAKMEQEFDRVEEGKIEWIKIIDEFYQEFEINLQKRKQKWRKLKLKMNLQVKIVRNVDIQWYLKWADMESLWHVVISQNAEIQNQLSKKLV